MQTEKPTCPPEQGVSNHLWNHYLENRGHLDRDDLPSAFWALRNEINSYIENGIVKDSFMNEVFDRVLSNVDVYCADFTPEQIAALKSFLAEELDAFPGIAGLAMMAEACELDNRLLSFLDSIRQDEEVPQ